MVLLGGGCEADEVVPELPAKGRAAVGDLRLLVANLRLRKTPAHMVRLRLAGFWRAEVRSDC